MKTARTLASLAVAALVGLAFAAPASAITLQRSADVVVAQNVALKAGDSVSVTKTANLRASPSTKGKKVATLAKGTKLSVVSVEKGGWVKVKGAAGDGYVSAKLVK